MATTANGILGKYGTIFKKLQQQSAGQFVDAGVAPEQAEQVRAPIGYGVFASGLSGALQQQSSDPAFGALSRQALAEYADQERATIAQMSEADRQAAFAAVILPKIIEKADATTGQLGEFDVSALGPYGRIINPVSVAANQAIAQRGRIESGRKTTAEALGAERAAGIEHSTDVIRDRLSHPVFGRMQGDDFQTDSMEGYNLFESGLSPKEQADITTAEAAMKRAEADMYSAHNAERVARAGRSSGDSSGTTTTFVVPVQGGGMATIKGKDGQAVLAEGMDARNYNRSDRPDAPTYGPNRLQHVKNVAKQRNLTVRDTPSGIIVQDSRGNTVRYDRNGKVVR